MGSLRNSKHEKFARERALLVPTLTAARRAGYEIMTAGNAAKLDRNKKIRARIKELQAIDEDMVAAKRARLDERLSAAAFANVFDFVKVDEATKLPVIDWDAVNESDASVIISEFAFDKETGALTRFKKDDPLNAISQLRDMYGFKAPTKAELTGKDGAPLVPSATDDVARAKAIFDLIRRVKNMAPAKA